MLTAWRAALIYAVATVVMTWPLVTTLGTAMPADLGDPLLNAWILAWGADHITAILGGDLQAYGRWWQGNIFHPAPLSLAYSEHLTPQVLFGLPVWWLTRNVLLTYNVLYLASYVLSATAMFLLVRELTGRPRAALVAGLFFAFVPYRIAQAPHLQVLWSQWMPLTLFALRRFFERRSYAALAGAGAALVVQQLSCGYYLIYFTPFVALYVAWELSARSLWRHWRLLLALAIVAVVDLLVVSPFVAPYLELRALGFQPRPLQELAKFSADTTAYFAVHEANRAWGTLLSTPARPENELFPGAVPVIMATVGLAALALRRWRATAALGTPRGWKRWTLGIAAGCVVFGLLAATVFVLTGGVTIRPLLFPEIRVRGLARNLAFAVAGMTALLVLWPRLRAMFRWGADLRGCALLFAAIAVVLSWGPTPVAAGRGLGFDGPYLWLYQHVPGFDGLRVPARMAMVAYVFLAVLSGYGLAVLDRRASGSRWMLLAGALFLVEATSVPITIGENWGDPGVAMPEGRVRPEGDAPAVYRHLATLPAGTILAEIPFGYPSWELRYVFYSSVHHHPIINGYSGGFPYSYIAAAAALMAPLEAPDRAWQALRSAGATHVVVHRAAFDPVRADAILEWLGRHGARHAATFGQDELVVLPR